MTPYKISKGTGVSCATLTSWKNGSYTPKLDKIRLIADFLQVDIKDITEGGSAEPFARSTYAKGLPGWSYRDMWWKSNNKDGAFMARGVHGQAIYIDPAAEMVLIRLASSDKASNTLLDPMSLPAYQVVADYLLGK